MANELLDALLLVSLTDKEDSFAVSDDAVIDPLYDDELLRGFSIHRYNVALSLIEEGFGMESYVSFILFLLELIE